jgi:hypothetical protein
MISAELLLLDMNPRDARVLIGESLIVFLVSNRCGSAIRTLFLAIRNLNLDFQSTNRFNSSTNRLGMFGRRLRAS